MDALTPQVVYEGLLDMQVCVPADWPDERIIAFADSRYPCGTTAGWRIRRNGEPALAGAPERVPCSRRTGYVHVMLDA